MVPKEENNAYLTYVIPHDREGLLTVSFLVLDFAFRSLLFCSPTKGLNLTIGQLLINMETSLGVSSLVCANAFAGVCWSHNNL